MAQFVERRKENRLPFEDKIIFTDGKRTFTGYTTNISRGGVFVTSTEPYPIDTKGQLMIFIPGQKTSFCFKAQVVHIVFDRQRCEVDNGMGFMFQELADVHKKILDAHIREEEESYLKLKEILSAERPDSAEMAKWLKKLPHLKNMDLLGLRYKVNRICTLFEPVEPGVGTAQKRSA